mmetsp:Transcript_43452/g.101484  ORF Transcript_43452/g.101484 Transcript_43452/m.101484 type:complete len:299 (+) Transcript_43452:508-1404(+)
MNTGRILLLPQRGVRKDALEVLSPLLHLVGVGCKVGVHKEHGGVTYSEGNLCATFVANEIGKPRGNLAGLRLPAELPQRSVGEDHDVHRTHGLRADHAEVLAEVAAHLTLPPGLVGPDERLLNGTLALAGADDVDMMPRRGRHPLVQIRRGLLPVEVPDSTEHPEYLIAMATERGYFCLFPVVKGGLCVGGESLIQQLLRAVPLGRRRCIFDLPNERIGGSLLNGAWRELLSRLSGGFRELHGTRGGFLSQRLHLHSLLRLDCQIIVVHRGFAGFCATLWHLIAGLGGACLVLGVVLD